MFLLWLRQLPSVRIRSLLQFPHPWGQGPVLLTLMFSPPSSFVLPSLACVYIFFSTGQVLLTALSWCSACASVSEGVFLMCHGERCNPGPPTPPPSSLFLTEIFKRKNYLCLILTLQMHRCRSYVGMKGRAVREQVKSGRLQCRLKNLDFILRWISSHWGFWTVIINHFSNCVKKDLQIKH